MEVEEWRAIRDYEGWYEVSSFGRVRCLERTIIYKDGRRRIYPQLILKPVKDKDGYYLVILWKNKSRKKKPIHRLVAETFLERPIEKKCVDHIDGNKSNNRAENLRWCTHKENMNNPITKSALQKSKEKQVGISVTQYSIDGRVIKTYPSATAAHKETGVDITQILGVCSGRIHYNTAGGYKWRYNDEAKKKSV